MSTDITVREREKGDKEKQRQREKDRQTDRQTDRNLGRGGGGVYTARGREKSEYSLALNDIMMREVNA